MKAQNRKIVQSVSGLWMKEKKRRKSRIPIPTLTERYSAVMGLKPASVKITSAKRRFALQRQNGICFRGGLRRTPTRDRICQVHELAHTHNHSRRFMFRAVYAHYRSRIKLLKSVHRSISIVPRIKISSPKNALPKAFPEHNM
ncbi:MAG: YgjP-like metallopeptidase domain-containing protein [Oscillospiraceae bacterium]